MSLVGVLKARGRGASRATTIVATLIVLMGLSLLISSAALAHAPDGWAQVDLVEGNTNPEDAGDLYYSFDGDTVYIHWHLDEAFEGEVTNQIVCAGEYAITPPADRCKPGQAEDGTVFWADPIGSDDWSFVYTGDETSFQIHLSITGAEDSWSILANFSNEGSSDDGTGDDGTGDDGTGDDGTGDDGTGDDGTGDDGTGDDGTGDDGTGDDGSTDGTEVQGNTTTKAKPKTEVGGEVLAKTGPETTMLAIIGLVFLMLGAAMRFARFGGSPAFAMAPSKAQDRVAEALRRRARGWTCNG